MRQTAQGLQHANQSGGLIHRDIKPGNVLVDRKGVVKILDLGLARFFQDEEAPITQKFDENVLGTADYLAPEQALDSHNVDIRADIYSLGATFYFCLTGCTPFEGTVAQKLIWHQTRQPKPVRSLRADVPEEMAAVLEKMMAKDPAQRYSTPSEVMEALAPWTQGDIPPPAEHEMPRLSPAAMGATGDGNSDAPFVPASNVPAPSSRRWHSKPLSSAARSNVNAPSTIVKVPAVLVPAAQAGPATVAKPASTTARKPESSSVSWNSPAPETVNAMARADTASQSKRKRPAPTAVPAAKAKLTIGSIPPLWLAIGGGTVAGLVLMFLAIWLFRKPEPTLPPSVSPTERKPQDWFVTRHARPGSLKTLWEAVLVAKPNDHIKVLDDIEEDLFLDVPKRALGKDVTIESGDHPIRWKCPQNPKKGKFIVIDNVPGLRLKGFIFDGQHHVSELVRLGGSCSSLSIEDCQFEGINHTAIGLWNCTAERRHQVAFQRLRFTTANEVDSAISINANPMDPSPLSQELAVINCRFDGPFKAGVQVASPLNKAGFRGNRFNRVQDAFFFQKAAPPNAVALAIDGNTFFQVARCCHFQVLPFSTPASSVNMTNNLFFKCQFVAQSDDTERLKEAAALVFHAAGNVRDAATNEGNLPTAASVMTFTLPTEPADDARFLRYPASDPLAHAGTQRKPVGSYIFPASANGED
jgi:hypothetical protein